ncbi:hypothetical protein ElyMa_004695100 [Elysia marginata]|uniref:Uncharacterized protein n=1 Tax=Elysia marginata TaxID=1093978 RepID=A0AAV4I9Z0_9GAST|nr:hypothetical protein ElyMa_004695100 [Elysia marginata]
MRHGPRWGRCERESSGSAGDIRHTRINKLPRLRRKLGDPEPEIDQVRHCLAAGQVHTTRSHFVDSFFSQMFADKSSGKFSVNIRPQNTAKTRITAKEQQRPK